MTFELPTERRRNPMDQTPEERRRAFTWIEVARQASTILLAAGAAYMGIRIDLQAMAVEVVTARRDLSRHETLIERLRDNPPSVICKPLGTK